jgi:hypothetical protein
MSQRLWGGLLSGAVLCLAGLLCTAPAAALDFDGIKITPSIGYQGEYDDNIFRTKSNQQSDYINHILPGLSIEATPGKHEFEAHGRADGKYYSKTSGLDFWDYWAGGSGKLNFNRLQLRAHEEWSHINTFPNSALTQYIPRDQNALGGGFDFDMARLWGVGFDYNWDYYHYLDGAFAYLSNNYQTFSPNVYYRLTGKTRLFAEFSYVDNIYWNDHTYSNNQYKGYLGIRGDVTDYFKVMAKVGYGVLHLTNSTQSDLGTPVAAIEMTYKPIERFEIVWLLTNDFTFTTDQFNPMINTFNTSIGLKYNITPKISIIPTGQFGVNWYPNLQPGQSEKRQDYLYGGGLGFRYDILKWVRFEASYMYTGRSSNYSVNDYSDNRVFFTLTLAM